MDECGFNIWTARTHGRSYKGQRAVRVVCGQRGQNLSLLMADSKILPCTFYDDRRWNDKEEIRRLPHRSFSLLLDEGNVAMVFDNSLSLHEPDWLHGTIGIVCK